MLNWPKRLGMLNWTERSLDVRVVSRYDLREKLEFDKELPIKLCSQYLSFRSRKMLALWCPDAHILQNLDGHHY